MLASFCPASLAVKLMPQKYGFHTFLGFYRHPRGAILPLFLAVRIMRRIQTKLAICPESNQPEARVQWREQKVRISLTGVPLAEPCCRWFCS